MTRRVLLLEHTVPNRADRVSLWLESQGHEIAWCSPALGQSLPPAEDYDALVVYGGVEMLSTDSGLPYIRQELDFVAAWLARDKPYLGICLGSQIMAKALGARVGPRPDGRYELGYTRIEPTGADPDFLPAPLRVYQWHQEGWELPAGAEHLARSAAFENQAMRYGRRAYGIQFHPETKAETVRQWLTQIPGACERPGADGRDKQLADAALCDAPMGDWFEGFLARWINN